MGLMERLRGGTDSTAMQVVLALVLVSFVFWYAKPGGDTTFPVATVNGYNVMDTAFSREYSSLQGRLRTDVGEGPTDDQLEELRLEAVNNLIRREALRQEAVSLGLTASLGEIHSLIRHDPNFFDPEKGVFDATVYDDYVKQSARAESDINEDYRTKVLLQKLYWMVTLGATMSEGEEEQAFKEQQSFLRLDFLRLTPGVVEKRLTVTDGEVAAWLEANKDKVKATYDADFATEYDVPMQVHLQVIKVIREDKGPSETELSAMLEKLRKDIDGGASFEDLARQWSEDQTAGVGGDQGMRKVTGLPSDVRAAIETVDVGKLSDVVVGDRDLRFYRVAERVPGRVVPLEEVEKDIARKLMIRERAPDEARVLADKVLESWKSEAELRIKTLDDSKARVAKLEADLAAKPGDAQLTMQLGAAKSLLDHLENAPAAPSSEVLGTDLLIQTSDAIGVEYDASKSLTGPPEDLVRAAADAEKGAVLPIVYTRKGNDGQEALFVAAVRDRHEADMAEFDKQRGLWREALLLGKRMEMWKDYGDDVVARSKVEDLRVGKKID